MFTANERYDYSIITIVTPSSYTLTNKVANNSSYTTITDIATSNLVGTTVCKYGYNGEFATGTIVYSDLQLYYNNQNCYIFGLVHVDLESGIEGTKTRENKFIPDSPIDENHKLR